MIDISATELEKSIFFIVILLIFGNILGKFSWNLIIASAGTYILYIILLEFSIKKYDKDADAVYLAVGVKAAGFALSFLFMAIRSMEYLYQSKLRTINIIIFILTLIMLVAILILPFFKERKIKKNKKETLGLYVAGPVLAMTIGKMILPSLSQQTAREVLFICCLFGVLDFTVSSTNIIIYLCKLKLKNDKIKNIEGYEN